MSINARSAGFSVEQSVDWLLCGIQEGRLLADSTYWATLPHCSHLDGKLHFPEAALGRFSPTVTTGQLPPLDDSGKQSSERLLNSETCRKTNSHNSAKAVGQQETVV